MEGGKRAGRSSTQMTDLSVTRANDGKRSPITSHHYPHDGKQRGGHKKGGAAIGVICILRWVKSQVEMSDSETANESERSCSQRFKNFQLKGRDQLQGAEREILRNLATHWGILVNGFRTKASRPGGTRPPLTTMDRHDPTPIREGTEQIDRKNNGRD